MRAGRGHRAWRSGALALALAMPLALPPAPPGARESVGQAVAGARLKHAVIVFTPDLTDPRYLKMLEQHAAIEQLWRGYGTVFVGISPGRLPEVVGGQIPSGLDIDTLRRQRGFESGFGTLLVDASGRTMHRRADTVPRAVLIAKLDEAVGPMVSASPAPAIASPTPSNAPLVAELPRPTARAVMAQAESILVPRPHMRPARSDVAARTAPVAARVDETTSMPEREPAPAVAGATPTVATVAATPLPAMRPGRGPATAVAEENPALNWPGSSTKPEPITASSDEAKTPWWSGSPGTEDEEEASSDAPVDAYAAIAARTYAEPIFDEQHTATPPEPEASAPASAPDEPPADVMVAAPLGALDAALPASTLARIQADRLETRLARARQEDGFEDGVLDPELPIGAQAAMRVAAGPLGTGSELSIAPMLLVTHSCGANVDPIEPEPEPKRGLLAALLGR